MSDRPFNCPKCCKPTNIPDVWCDECGGRMAQMNVHMLLDGLRCAEQYEREFTEQMIDRDDEAGPGRMHALVALKLAARNVASEFVDEIARRADK